jgi:hypothetical protein
MPSAGGDAPRATVSTEASHKKGTDEMTISAKESYELVDDALAAHLNSCAACGQTPGGCNAGFALLEQENHAFRMWKQIDPDGATAHQAAAFRTAA